MHDDLELGSAEPLLPCSRWVIALHNVEHRKLHDRVRLRGLPVKKEAAVLRNHEDKAKRRWVVT